MSDRLRHIDKKEVSGDEYRDDGGIEESAESSKSVKDQKDTEPKERVGAILKKAREQQGLSLEIVHEATKIPLDALRAIEEDYTIRVLSPFYVSGFVKMYAKYLNTDISDVVDDHKEELPEPIEPVDEDIEIPKWFTELLTRERKQQMVIGAGILLVFFLLVKLIGFIGSLKPESQPAVEKETVTIEAVKKEVRKAEELPRQETRTEPPKIITPKEAPKVVAPVAPKPPEPPAPKPVQSTPPPAVVQKDVNLTVRANQNSWLRVKTDGNVVFQSTLRTGAVETWLADKEIEISGRNISQLEFELNGKMIGTLGRKDRNAKKVIITKQGLSVRQ